MHNAKITSDELKSFYTQRAAIEEEYSRKILNLARKPLGSSEAGTLRMSMDVLRGELEAMGKSHQHIAQQESKSVARSSKMASRNFSRPRHNKHTLSTRLAIATNKTV
jgi:hypothetical protein